MKLPDTILIADDNDAGLYVKGRILQRAGYRVLTASTGKECLRLAESEKPSLVVLDVKLPDVSGLEVCRQIKVREQSVLVLQTSAAFTEKTDKVAALAGGADGYLVEPMEPSELVSTVEALLRLRRAEQKLRKTNVELEQQVVERVGELVEAQRKLHQESTQRAAAEDTLRHTQKLDILGQLTGGIAHDFNNLLAIVLGNLESLRRHLGPDEKRLATFADNAYYGARRAATLTRQLLAFSRRQSLAPRPLQLTGIVSDIMALMRQTIGDQMTVKADIATSLWPVFVDQGELEAAILNLAVNARDAVGGTGEISLIVGNVELAEGNPLLPAGEYVAVAIRDNGVGMSPDVVKYAFEPFFTTKDVGHGTGLGLAQVHGFVTQAGGQIGVDSVVGEGTTMTLYLPRYHGEVDESVPAEPEPEVHAAQQGCILIVEDNELVRAHAVGIVEELGYQVMQCADGPSALEMLAVNKIDLLFTDIGLPNGIDGVDLADRARDGRADLPVLLATGYARPPVGASMYPLLNKPYTFADVGAKLRELLPPAPAPANVRRILVVEDESLIRIDIADALRDLGFEVEEAASAGGAQKFFAPGQHALDAIVVDLGLPDRKGDDFAAEIRAAHPRLPIVIASGYASEQVHARFRNDSQTAFIDKPYNAAQLEQTIARLRTSK